jgi:hypothetical protein
MGAAAAGMQPGLDCRGPGTGIAEIKDVCIQEAVAPPSLAAEVQDMEALLIRELASRHKLEMS